MIKTYKSTWHKMRELVILSLNIVYIKDLLQQCDRLVAKLEYMNFTIGSITVTQDTLIKRKHELNKRMKELLEDVLNQKGVTLAVTEYAFNIDIDHASLTRKQMEKGYALFTNVRDHTYALNLRNGALLPINLPEVSPSDRNLMSLEYTAQHEGPVYRYFEIDITDPLKNELRY